MAGARTDPFDSSYHESLLDLSLFLRMFNTSVEIAGCLLKSCFPDTAQENMDNGAQQKLAWDMWTVDVAGIRSMKEEAGTPAGV